MVPEEKCERNVEQDCRMTYETTYSYVTEEKCRTVQERQCKQVMEQKCRTRYKNVRERQCNTVNVETCDGDGSGGYGIADFASQEFASAGPFTFGMDFGYGRQQQEAKIRRSEQPAERKTKCPMKEKKICKQVMNQYNYCLVL